MGCTIRLVMQKYYLQRVLKNFYGNNIPTCFLWYSSHKVGFGTMGIDRWFGVTEPSRSAVALYYPFCQNGNDYNSNQQQNTSSLSFCKIKILFHVNIPKKYRYIKNVVVHLQPIDSKDIRNCLNLL